MQLAHAGRKGSTHRPWSGQGAIAEDAGGWVVPAPSAEPFASNFPTPKAIAKAEIQDVVTAFAAAARRVREAGFDVIEVHAAHGYLIHEFMSPLSNHRQDEYGGSFENRTRLLREVVVAIRREWPESAPLFVRLSATDWTDGGWDLDQSIEMARVLKTLGVDLIDCSSGGNVAQPKIPLGPGYQVPFAERIRAEAAIMTAAVGLITTAAQAQQIIESGQADAVLLARELLRDPYWPMRAARELGQPMPWPVQYLRAAPGGAAARGEHWP
jgi:2,4-dienoyl-CoA reductase-like NADH-dependent reductase (Old Yellow Enzyme family)